MRYGQPWQDKKAFLGERFVRIRFGRSLPVPSTTLRRERRPLKSGFQSQSGAGTGTFNRQPSSASTSLFCCAKAGAGILNLLAIAYALRPRLRSRLTLGGRTFPRKPWVYGDPGISPGLSLLMSAFSLVTAPRVWFSPPLPSRDNAPLPPALLEKSADPELR